MSLETSDHFFAQLPPLTDFAEVLVSRNYQELPEDWWLVVTDVEGSTQAIAEGRYQEINSLGGCTVAAVLNAVKPLVIPYVFGGDGASFCIPPGCVATVRNALLGCREMAATQFQLNLRTGLLPYRRVREEAQVLVCRFKKSEDLHQAIFAGGGMLEADRLVKLNADYHVRQSEGHAEADFSGFECRWQRVPSPLEVTVSLLVEVTAKELEEQLKDYQALLQKMQALLGNDEHQQPLSIEGMRLSFDRDKLASEARANSYMQAGSGFAWQVWKLRLINLVGLLLMKLGIRLGGADWGRYKSDAILSSDFRKFDGMFRSIFTARQKDLDGLTVWLEDQRQAGVLNYGVHVSDAAQLTCLVSQAGVHHIHFVDGCDGGYALAARELKQQQLTGKGKT
ncbi:DUF3095 domain-containing protein [Marinospirillum sp.]|uniref:DUF3095 domain-containing protein n=1 Tax=Marinospirillum sp. TaxID=2183934 RepID=UPI0028708FBE|nr:DUF3095 domain-containing protein [Marinospirillum sp.]MDR9467801.1 DUF3095 domain-containing protein [Marinospirillum sp.]